MEKLRRDSVWLGVIMGVAVPALIFYVLWGILAAIFYFMGKPVDSVLTVVEPQKLILLSVIPNLFLLRYYLLKLKYDLTGRGILAVTFVIGIIFAILEFL
ncbi:MAG: hypothetical protein J6W84_08275 [Bacteroidales bacterium]|nr:hypothetical protein [Bacteroidales bacterium]MBQ7490394.1 hypothetical protein [Bacteroidales bacterium]